MPGSSAEFLIQTTQGIEESVAIQSEAFLAFFWIVKFVFLTFSVIFFLHIVYLIFKINSVQGKTNIYKDALIKKTEFPYKGEFVTRWSSIRQRMNTMHEAEYKLAIIEADKIFDDLLKRMNIKGEDMGGRLKNINKELLPSIDKIWKSHKIRNKIAHDTGFHLGYDEAQDVVNNYEESLRELRILD